MRPSGLLRLNPRPRVAGPHGPANDLRTTGSLEADPACPTARPAGYEHSRTLDHELDHGLGDEIRDEIPRPGLQDPRRDPHVLAHGQISRAGR
jgi:hypothetical protein